MEKKINETQRKDILYIDPRQIKIEEGFNTRTDYGNIDELMNSIIENGVKIPLRGFKDGDFYIITDGHRRLTATMKAIENELPIEKFTRVHRSFIVNTSSINIIEDNAIIIKTHDGAKSIPIGKSYKDKLMDDINLIIK